MAADLSGFTGRKGKNMAEPLTLLEHVRRVMRSIERELDSNNVQAQRLLAKNEVLKDRYGDFKDVEKGLVKIIEDLEQTEKEENSLEDKEAVENITEESAFECMIT